MFRKNRKLRQVLAFKINSPYCLFIYGYTAHIFQLSYFSVKCTLEDVWEFVHEEFLHSSTLQNISKGRRLFK